MLRHRDDVVEGVRDPPPHTRPVDRQPGREIPFSKSLQSIEELGAVDLRDRSDGHASPPDSEALGIGCAGHGQQALCQSEAAEISGRSGSELPGTFYWTSALHR